MLKVRRQVQQEILVASHSMRKNSHADKHGALQATHLRPVDICFVEMFIFYG
jgi:hypothetical protein